MENEIFLFDVEGQKALGFDTGLDSRAFARAKFAQFITEPGFIVSINGQPPSVKLWKVSGVMERKAADGQSAMVVWGPAPFSSTASEEKRLDLLINDVEKRDKALAAISLWIRAILALGEKFQAPLWPCAALVGEGGSSGEVFFAPPGIATHCLMAKDQNKFNNRYVHPSLNGMNAAAFTAAAMLYRIFAGVSAFSAEDEIILHEDMREGNFLPVKLAAPGLRDDLAALMQSALYQGVKNNIGLPNGTRLLEELIAILRPDDKTIPAASFITRLSEADALAIDKEKTQYLKTKTASVNTKRFVRRNAVVLLCGFAAVVIAALIANSIIRGRSALTTAGMEPIQVIESYYNAFEKLDHQWMDACVINKAGKDDINTVINLFVMDKMRQAYGLNIRSSFIPAKEWLENGGGQTSFQVFGVTDMQITDNSEQVTGNREIHYRVDYTLWVPGEAAEESEIRRETDDQYVPPEAIRRTDYITLIQKKGNWRISEIKRVSEN